MSMSNKLVMLKGFDRNNREFTAFLICNDKQNKEIKEAKSVGNSLNLNEFDIIYVMKGHNVDEETQSNIGEFYNIYSN